MLKMVLRNILSFIHIHRWKRTMVLRNILSFIHIHRWKRIEVTVASLGGYYDVGTIYRFKCSKCGKIKQKTVMY